MFAVLVRREAKMAAGSIRKVELYVGSAYATDNSMIERLPLETQTLYAEFLAQLLSAATTHSIGQANPMNPHVEGRS